MNNDRPFPVPEDNDDDRETSAKPANWGRAATTTESPSGRNDVRPFPAP